MCIRDRPSVIHNKSVEGFGISYIEAAQYGVPSIGGKDGGASDAIIHEKTGIICDGNNLEEIYSSIDKLLKDHRYKEYGKALEIQNHYHDEICNIKLSNRKNNSSLPTPNYLLFVEQFKR